MSSGPCSGSTRTVSGSTPIHPGRRTNVLKRWGVRVGEVPQPSRPNPHNRDGHQVERQIGALPPRRSPAQRGAGIHQRRKPRRVAGPCPIAAIVRDHHWLSPRAPLYRVAPRRDDRLDRFIRGYTASEGPEAGALLPRNQCLSAGSQVDPVELKRSPVSRCWRTRVAEEQDLLEPAVGGRIGADPSTVVSNRQRLLDAGEEPWAGIIGAGTAG